LFFASIKFIYQNTQYGVFAEGTTPVEAINSLYVELEKQGFYP
jgi:hypothetical protein